LSTSQQVRRNINALVGCYSVLKPPAPLSSLQIHAALIHHVSSVQANKERIRTVGAWGVQRGAEAVLAMIRSAVDPVHGQAALASPA